MQATREGGITPASLHKLQALWWGYINSCPCVPKGLVKDTEVHGCLGPLCKMAHILTFSCYDKIQKQFGGQRVHLAYKIPIKSAIGGGKRRSSSRARPEAETMDHEAECWLQSGSSWIAKPVFFYSPGLPAQGWHHPQRIGSLTLIINQRKYATGNLM